MIGLLARIVGFVITAASGWAVSDIYNEHETSKQIGSAASIADSTKKAYSKNKGKWLWLAGGAVAAFLIITFIIKPLLLKGKTEKSIL